MTFLIVITCVVLLAVVFFFFGGKLKEKCNYKPLEGCEKSRGKDRIHFLNVGHSDCILIESGGKFALIDGGEDWDYPENKPNLKLKGYEEKIVEYLLENAADENGRVHLDFVLGTHAHSDHLGGLDTVIDHGKITVDKVYLKRYNAFVINEAENTRWDNQEVYDQTLEAAKRNNAELVQDLKDLKFTFGNFTLSVFNGEERTPEKKVGENTNSLAVLAEKDGKKILLCGDLNNRLGDEKRLAPIIGKVDLIKVGHHGYPGSTTMTWVRALSPKAAVVTNAKSAMYPTVRFNLAFGAAAAVYFTVNENGVIAQVDKEGISLYNGIM